jgi:hypothetical protein
MAPIDDAIAAIKREELGEQLVYQKYANKYGVNRSTLSRRHRSVLQLKQDFQAGRQALTPTEELELVQYIRRLTKQGLLPIREIVQVFSLTLLPDYLLKA